MVNRHLSLSQAKHILVPYFPAVQDQMGDKTAKKLLDSLRVERANWNEEWVTSSVGTFREGREVSRAYLSAQIWEGNVYALSVGVWHEEGTNTIKELV